MRLLLFAKLWVREESGINKNTERNVWLAHRNAEAVSKSDF